MSASNQVDVVVAEDEPMGGWEDLADVLGGPVEPVDVAPDPKRRIIVLAPSKKRGHVEAVALGIEPVAIVTPRSPHAARGFTADEIVEAEGLTVEERETLMDEVTPAIVTIEAD
jgi:hypothetical protein